MKGSSGRRWERQCTTDRSLMISNSKIFPESLSPFYTRLRHSRDPQVLDMKHSTQCILGGLSKVPTTHIMATLLGFYSCEQKPWPRKLIKDTFNWDCLTGSEVQYIIMAADSQPCVEAMLEELWPTCWRKNVTVEWDIPPSYIKVPVLPACFPIQM